MSSAPSSNGILAPSNRRNQLNVFIATRKRKLAQLYAVALSESPIPEPVGVHLHDVNVQGLSAFLDQNDIEKGRSFKRSSIPSRRQNTEPPSRHSKRLAVSSRSQSPLPLSLNQTTGIHTKNHPSIRSDNQRLYSISSANEDDGEKRTRHTISQNVLQGSSNTRSSKLQQKPVHTPSGLHQHNPNRESTGQSTEDIASLDMHAGGGPFETSSSGAFTRQDGAIASEVAVNPGTGLDSRSVIPRLNDAVLQNQGGSNMHGEPGSSASSTEGLPSTNTPRTDIHSPATSADEDHVTPRVNASHNKSTDIGKLLPDEKSNRKSQTLRVSHCNENEQMTTLASESYSVTSPASHSDQSRQFPHFSRSRSPSKFTLLDDPTQPAGPQLSEHSTIKSFPQQIHNLENGAEDVHMNETTDTNIHDKQISGRTPQHISDLNATSSMPDSITKLEVENSASSSMHNSQPMSNRATQPRAVQEAGSSLAGQPPPSPPMSIVGNSQDLEFPSSRTETHFQFLGDMEKFSVVLSDGKHPVTPPPEEKFGLKEDYMRTMFSAQAYRDYRQASLKDLIKKSSKILMTSDFLIEVCEQRDIRIVKRIWTMQNTHRWSLRHWKPCPEPLQNATSQDNLLRQMKWLQVDFREERKFKIALAKCLADACAEWKATDMDKRHLLEGKYAPRAQDSMVVDQEDLSNLLSLRPDELRTVIPEGSLSQKILEKLPVFGLSTSYTPAHLDATMEKKGVRRKNDLRSAPPTKRQKYESDAVDTEFLVAPALPPKDRDCALFDPASKHLRDRLTAPHAYKHPTDVRMPEQAFYEARAASQWTKDDDARLREYVRDCTANWALIAENMTSRSLFRSGPDRRNSWECYERLLGIETPPPEIARHPYHQQFHRRIETARQVVFAKQDALAQQYHAQNPGQSQVQFRRKFNSPAGTDRKNAAKRFLALLDASRKLARKREAAKQREAQQQGDSSIQAQRAAAMRRMQETPGQLKNATSTPQFYSNMKAEREENERKMLQQRRAYEIQRRAAAQQVGQQHALATGMASHMRGNASTAANSQLPQSAMSSTNGQTNGANTEQLRQHSHQHPAFQMGMVNGIPTQMNIKGMSQTNMQPSMQGQQRLHPSMVTGQMQRLMQQQTQQSRALQQASQQQLQQQQALLQQQALSQYGNSTNINLNSLNGFSNPNLLTSFNHLASGANDVQNAGIANVNGSSASPQLAHQLALANSQSMDAVVPTQPRLSGGLMPAVAHLSHQIAKQHPQFSPDQVNALANAKLQEHYLSQKQQALNAAAGIGPGGMTNAMQSQQQVESLQRSAYQQAGLMAPGSPLQSMTQGHSQFQQQIRQQMMSQNKMASMNAQAGNGIGPMGFGMNANRTPTPNPSMRPPSRSSGIGDANGQQLVRPGSAQSMASASPRPMSAGVAGNQ